MPKFKGIRVGRAVLPADAEAEAEIRKIPERRPLSVNVPVPRLPQTHNLLFGVLADVVDHWPHGADPNPDGDPEVLRAFLLCRVGWCEKIDVPLSTDLKMQQRIMEFVDNMLTRLRVKGEHPFIREGRIDGEPAMRVFIARSLNQVDVDEVKFREIEHAVFEEIEAITGIKVDDLIAAYKARKAQEAAARAA